MRHPVRLPLEALQPFLLEQWPVVSGQWAVVSHCSLATDHWPLPTRDCWPTIFGNDRPVEIEVGFGKGLFLVTAGSSRPDLNLVGIEIERKYALYVANRLAKRQLTNVRAVCGDARQIFEHLVPEASVQAIHVYFPDPWWKHRHRKRRLFSEAFVQACARVLRPGGIFHLASDVAEYFDEIQQMLARQTNLSVLPAPTPTEPRHDMDYLTNFERKYRREGRAIGRAAYVRG